MLAGAIAHALEKGRPCSRSAARILRTGPKSLGIARPRQHFPHGRREIGPRTQTVVSAAFLRASTVARALVWRDATPVVLAASKKDTGTTRGILLRTTLLLLETTRAAKRSTVSPGRALNRRSGGAALGAFGCFDRSPVCTLAPARRRSDLLR
jgi:hypothetical protein